MYTYIVAAISTQFLQMAYHQRLATVRGIGAGIGAAAGGTLSSWLGTYWASQDGDFFEDPVYIGLPGMSLGPIKQEIFTFQNPANSSCIYIYIYVYTCCMYIG